MRVKNHLIGMIVFLLLVSFAEAFNPHVVVGKWRSENGRQIIEVYYNEELKAYFGKVLWMAEDDPTLGTTMVDIKNDNPKLRSRRVTGIELLRDFIYSGNRQYYGLVYDPVSGNDYKCRITLSEDCKIAYVRGYILIPILGRTEISKKME
jgi:uncharacterized protein (DUF2147 family)